MWVGQVVSWVGRGGTARPAEAWQALRRHAVLEDCQARHASLLPSSRLCEGLLGEAQLGSKGSQAQPVQPTSAAHAAIKGNGNRERGKDGWAHRLAALQHSGQRHLQLHGLEVGQGGLDVGEHLWGREGEGEGWVRQADMVRG